MAVRAIRRCPASHFSPEGTKEDGEKERKQSRVHRRCQFSGMAGRVCDKPVGHTRLQFLGRLKEDHEVHAGDDAPGPTAFLLKERP